MSRSFNGNHHAFNMTIWSNSGGHFVVAGTNIPTVIAGACVLARYPPEVIGQQSLIVACKPGATGRLPNTASLR